MPQREADRRRQGRLLVEGLNGKMTAASQIEIVNMSLSGVAIKVDRRLNIGAEYTLKLGVGDHQLPVRGVVVWSVLSETHRSPQGETVPIYSAGMRFTDIMTQRLEELLSFIDHNKLVQEKRVGGLRFHIDAPGKAHLDYPHEYRVREISLTGMLIDMDGPLAVDSRHRMEIDLGPTISFVGRVATCSEVMAATADGPAHFEIGIEFQDMPMAESKKLSEYLHSLSQR